MKLPALWQDLKIIFARLFRQGIDIYSIKELLEIINEKEKSGGKQTSNSQRDQMANI